MNCEETRSRIEAHFDGETSGDERSQVEAHLSGCPECRDALEQMRLAWDALDAYEVPEPKPLDPARVLTKARTRARRTRIASLGTAIAATVLVGVLLWQVLGRRGGISVTPAEEMEIVNHWDVLENLEVLETLEVLEHMDLLEEMPTDAFNGSEKG